MGCKQAKGIARVHRNPKEKPRGFAAGAPPQPPTHLLSNPFQNLTRSQLGLLVFVSHPVVLRGLSSQNSGAPIENRELNPVVQSNRHSPPSRCPLSLVPHILNQEALPGSQARGE